MSWLRWLRMLSSSALVCSTVKLVHSMARLNVSSCRKLTLKNKMKCLSSRSKICFTSTTLMTIISTKRRSMPNGSIRSHFELPADSTVCSAGMRKSNSCGWVPFIASAAFKWQIQLTKYLCKSKCSIKRYPKGTKLSKLLKGRKKLKGEGKKR